MGKKEIQRKLVFLWGEKAFHRALIRVLGNFSFMVSCDVVIAVRQASKPKTRLLLLNNCIFNTYIDALIY